LKELEANFKLHVPGLDLPTLLAELSSAKPLYMVAPSKEVRQQYCEAITHLLRFDLVIQLHMYLVLLPGTKEATPNTPSEDQLGTSPGEDWAKRFASDKAPREVAELFERYSDSQYIP
jgi:hypothetical protein